MTVIHKNMNKSRFIEHGWIAMGERQAITPTDVEEIVLKSI